MQADCGKIVIAVSEDIDPTNTDAVLWSLAYRSNPVEDVHIEPYRSRATRRNPDRATMDSTMLIDATLKHPMSPLALAGARIHGTALAIWKELGLPALAVAPPWHGYSLGDWSEALDLSPQCRRRRVGEERPTRSRGGAAGLRPKRRCAASKARAFLSATAKDQAEARAEPAMRSVSSAAISRGHCTGVRCRAPGITVSLELGMASCKLRDMATGVA